MSLQLIRCASSTAKIPNDDRVVGTAAEKQLWTVRPEQRANGCGVPLQDCNETSAGLLQLQHRNLTGKVANENMLRERIELHGCAPSLECVTADFIASLNAMCSERLIASTRQNPSGVLGEDDAGDSSVVCEIFLNRSQASMNGKFRYHSVSFFHEITHRLQSSESKNCEIVPFSCPTKMVRVSGT